MDAKLGKEISAFAKEAKRLRKILSDTKKIFGDINVTGTVVGKTSCHFFFFYSTVVLNKGDVSSELQNGFIRIKSPRSEEFQNYGGV